MNVPKCVTVALVVIVSIGSVSAQSAPVGGCKSMTGHEASHDMRWMGSGILLAPRRAIKLSNLKWELPVLAATVVMVNVADTPASRQINNVHAENVANTFSNIGLYSELAVRRSLRGRLRRASRQHPHCRPGSPRGGWFGRGDRQRF